MDTDIENVNIPLIRKTLEHIVAHPEEWLQSRWYMTVEKLREQKGECCSDCDSIADETIQRLTEMGNTCGAAACFAGWAATFAGHQITFDEWQDAAIDTDDGRRLAISDAARCALGIGFEDSIDLFRASNTLVDLKHQVAELTDGEVDLR